VLGLSVGAFGLLGREVMNRRFGHASLIAFSSRTLPVSDKVILLNFFIKDLIYYFILYILPLTIGISTAFILHSESLSYAVFLISISLSFLAALSASFVLSTIYLYSEKAAVLFFAIILYLVVFDRLTLPSLLFFFQPSALQILMSLSFIIVTLSVSFMLFKVDYPVKENKYKNYFDLLSRILAFGKQSNFVSKDVIDLIRSEGGLGKIIFSLLLPTFLIWFVLLEFQKIIPFDFILVFAILLGVISSSTYNWLTEFDLSSSYSFLPIKVSDIIKSKVMSYALINSLCIIVLVAASFMLSSFNSLAQAIFGMVSISFYVLAILINLTGLHPNILLYNPKILIKYLFFISPFLVLLIFLSGSRLYFALNLFIFSLALIILKHGLGRWDEKEEIVF
jgi:hypothetical protein